MATARGASEVGLLRLVAQGLIPQVPRAIWPSPPTAQEVVRRLGAMQAQEPASAALAVAVRSPGADLPAAFDTGLVVSSWPQRGTLHLLAAEDAHWVLELVAAPSLARFARRHLELGLTPELVATGASTAAAALSGGVALTRVELLAAFTAAGIDVAGQRGYHLIVTLAHRGLICLGPLRGKRQAFVLLDEWVPAPRRPDRAEGLREWALRYFTGHGPATPRDFATWTKLPAADAREAVAAARPDLAAMDVEGVEHLLDPAVPDLLAAHRKEAAGVHLLPAFDEFVLGYGDRGAVLDPAYADRICPGGNGMFRPTVVERGRVVGVWRAPGPRRPEATVEPFGTTASPAVERAVRTWQGTARGAT